MSGSISSQYGTFSYTDTGSAYSATGPGGWSATIGYEVPAGNQVTGDGYGFGWGPYYGIKAAALQSIVNAINAKIKDLTDSDMRDDLRVLKIRGESPDLGIYQNHVCVYCEDDRALLMNALNETGITQNVLSEKNSPTKPSTFFKRNAGV